MPSLIEVHDLVKRYPGVNAVDGVSFEVEQGSCFGLLGPNGAGKTTTLEMMEGITPPTQGEIRYRGQPLDGRYREEIGIQFQSTALQDFQTVRESLIMFAALYQRSADIDTLVDLCQLGEFLDRDTRKLSGGQRQRLLLAIALVNEPSLVYLDEPTTGLDPQSRRNFWALIKGIRREGKTIVLTTHYMEEAHRLCSEIAIVDQGKIIVRGQPDRLLRNHFPTTAVRLPSAAIPPTVSLPEGAHRQDGKIQVFTDDVSGTITALQDNGVVLSDLQVSSPTLEDLFLKLTGHALRG